MCSETGLMTSSAEVDVYRKELERKYAYLSELEAKYGGFSHPLIVEQVV